MYDFTLDGHGRHRHAGFRTRAEACAAERQKREELLMGRKRFLLSDAYEMYMSATTMRPGTIDHRKRFWSQIEPCLGHLYIEQVDTSAIDELKQSLPDHLGPESINNRTKVVRAVLRFMWKRGHLPSVPYVPMESAPEQNPEWYTEQERDRFLDGMFERFPQWYTFFYIMTRLGLRAGEVYAISRDRVREVPPMLIVDRAVQRGHKGRPAVLGPRKNNRVLTLSLTQDVVDAIRWHIKSGFSGPEFLLSKDGSSPKKIHSHARPMHLGKRAQLRIVADLESPPLPSHPRQREPEGRSPARSAAKAEHSESRGGRITGGGGRAVQLRKGRPGTDRPFWKLADLATG